LAVSLQSTFELFRKPNTEIEIKIADDLPKIQGDTARLKIAVTELVRNACEATAETGGKVLIEIRAEAVPGQRTEQILIRVSDNGSGIPADQVQRVFQPFHSARRKANAAGLGLALVSSIVSLHKGVVRLESQPGRTLAEIRLPLSE
jgi:signal transduction histidine kinase